MSGMWRESPFYEILALRLSSWNVVVPFHLNRWPKFLDIISPLESSGMRCGAKPDMRHLLLTNLELERESIINISCSSKQLYLWREFDTTSSRITFWQAFGLTINSASKDFFYTLPNACIGSVHKKHCWKFLVVTGDMPWAMTSWIIESCYETDSKLLKQIKKRTFMFMSQTMSY